MARVTVAHVLLRCQRVGSILLFALAALQSDSQTLHRRDSPVTLCQPVEIRLAAKYTDGSAATLSEADLKIGFAAGPANVVSLASFASMEGPSGVTDILFVVPPYGDFGSPVEMATILNTLARAEGFRFRAAVLGPDGVMSAFSPELDELSSSLRSAVKAKQILREMGKWVPAEEAAFLQLRHLMGRHVIVRLFNDVNPLGFRVKYNFAVDRSFDLFSAFDGAMVYKLLSPVDLTQSIPRGDASTEAPIRAGNPDSGGVEQTQRLDGASQHKSQLWAQSRYWSSRMAGGLELSIADLMRDVIKDQRAGYDLIVQPRFSCRPGEFRSVSVAVTDTKIRLFAPRAVQMIPYRVQAEH